jgi:1-acyl-sn-glycerol-3-phosphate acyltransferase
MDNPVSEFDDIRPYMDHEVRPVLDRLVSDRELLDSILAFKLGGLGKIFGPVLRPFLAWHLRKQASPIRSVRDFQETIESYLIEALDKSVSELSVSGLDKLDKNSAYLFVSNHRDITMDPALVNLSIYRKGFSTLRIAIGDNLLTKPFASDLMRLNKSFIVKRSVQAPREKLKAAKKLSQYIHTSVLDDNENVWIAQREGRAKDGKDVTNSAVIGMLALSRPKPQKLGDFIREAKLVPVAISYEYDPCDQDKANELHTIAQTGTYQKSEHEDVKSIAKGITGYKGRVHLAFGEPLDTDYESTDQVTEDLNKRILNLYCLHPSNAIAYELLEKVSPRVKVGQSQLNFVDHDWQKERAVFKERLSSVSEDCREIYLRAYANPVYAKLAEH